MALGIKLGAPLVPKDRNKAMKYLITRFKNDESGATAIEYGLIAGLISVAIVAVLIILGPQLAEAFQSISDELPDAPT
jgi:pilus assembly protein Flp/PilA